MATRVLLALAVLANTAVAQPPTPQARQEPEELRSPSTALMLSVGTTLSSFAVWGLAARNDNVALIATGSVLFFAGPSVGQFYAGNYLSGGLVVRAVGGGLIAWGAANTSFLSTSDDADDGEGMIVLGGIVYLGGMIYEIATAPSSAREYNRRHAQTSIGVTPLVRNNAGGVALTGSF